MSKLTSIRVLLSRTLALFGKRVFVTFTAQKRVVSKLAILVLILTPVASTVYSITRAGTSANNTAYAVSPTTLNFQARLLTSSGNLVPDGIYNVEFKIYNVDTAGTALWTETRLTTDPASQQISVKNGYLSVYLGDKTALPTNIWNQQLWLTMNIGGTSGTPSWDGEMTPRIRLTSVPFAFRATVADSAEILSKNTGSFTGTVDFANMTADRKFILPDTSLATTASPGTICVYNGAASNCPAASGSAYYLQNDTVLQTQTNFHIQARDSTTNGTIGGVISGATAGQTVDLLQFRASDDTTVLAAVTAAGNLQVASSVDTRSAATLNIGNSTATAVSIGKSGITTTVNGALTVSEATTLNNTLTVTGATTLTGGATIRGLTVDTATATDDRIALNITAGGIARFDGSITNADLTAARTWTLPDVSGTFITTGNLTAINQVGTITAGTWNGTSLADAYVDDSITISSAGSVDWTALTGYPAACAAGQALTQLGDTVTCSSFATGSAASYIQNQNSAQQATSNFWISGSGQAGTSIITPTVTSTGALSITSAANGNITVDANGTGTLNLQDSVIVAAQQTIQMVGGTTAQRPASPTEGMIYFDTSTKQLLTYANGKWQGDRSTATKIVAASNSSQAVKDAADYIASGTGDQNTINAALTAAAGGKVYLAEGTFTVNGSIVIPSNTTLSGSGNGTLITIPNSFNADLQVITNSDTTSGNTGITIRDFKLDGNKSNNTAGNQSAVWLVKVSPSATNSGAVIEGLVAQNFRLEGIAVFDSFNTSITNNQVFGNNGEGIYTDNFNIASYSTIQSGNKISNNVSSGNATGLGAYYQAGLEILGNTIISNTTGIAADDGLFRSTISGNNISSNVRNGIELYTGTNNIISENTFYDNGSTGNYDAIRLGTASNNQVTNNNISDTAGIGYAINITDSGSNTNYLADNTFSGTGASSINDAGTGTIYGGQANGSGNYVIQPAGTVELMKNTNVTGNLSVSGTTTTRGLTVNTATATDDQILVTVAAGGAARFNGTITNADLTAARTWTLPDESGTFCMQGSTNCGFAPTTGGTGYIQNQNASQQATSNFWISGTGRADTSILTPLLDTASATALNIGTTNATAINLNKNVTVASGKTLTVAGGTTYLNSDPSGTVSPTFIASSTIQNPGTSISFSRPGTAMSGDLAIIFLATSSGRTVTPPSGWTTVTKDTSTGTGFNLDGTMFYKTLTSSEPASWSFGVSSNSNLSGTLVVYRNAVIGTTAVTHSSNPGASFSTPTISTTAGATVLSSWTIMSSTAGSGFGAATAVPDAAVTNRTGTITGSDAFARSVLGEQVVNSSGTTTARSVTASNSSNFDAVTRTIEILGSSGGTDALVVSNSTSAANVAVFKDNSRNVFTIANEGVATFQNATDSTGAFSVQNAAGTSLLSVDTTNSLVTVTSLRTNSLTVNTATATDDQILVTVAAGGAARFNGTITNADLTAARTWTLPDESGTFCMQGSTNCGFAPTTGGTGYIQNQNAGQQATSNFWISGTGRADTSITTPLIDTPTAAILNIGTTNATQINLNKNVVVAASQSLTITGGNTASRPAAPTEGMLYFDTTTKQLLIYANGKWQADRSSSTKIVGTSATGGASGAAASISPDSADYVNTSTTSAQTVINSALSSMPASGGTVYLMEGTYIVDGSITIPNNVTLAGAGYGTIIKVANGVSATLNIITNTDQTTGTNVSVTNLSVDGNSTNVTGTQNGVGMVGIGSTASARSGARITNIWARNFTSYGIGLATTANNIISDNSLANNTSAGLYMQNTTTTTVTGNVVRNNVIGLSLVGGSGNSINANVVSLNTSGGIVLNTSNYMTINANQFSDNGGSTTNNSIYLTGADNNTISSNTITDSSATTNNFAINVFNATSDNNQLTGNNLGGGTINDAGTGTIYGGQLNGSGNFVIQPAGTVELMKNTNVTGNLSVSGTTTTRGLIVNTATATDDQILISVATGGAARFNGTITNTDLTAARTWTFPDASGTICLDSGVNNCGYLTTTAAATGYVQFAPGSAQTDSSANPSIYINDTAGGNLIQLQAGAADKFVVDNTGAVTAKGSLTISGVTTDITTGTNEDLTVVANGTGVINLNDSITAGGNITFASGANRSIGVAVNASNAAGYNLTLSAGAAGSGASAFAGGVLTLQGGAAGGTGNANGGAVAISGGAGVGTGAQGLVALSTSAFTTLGPLSFGADTNVNALSAGAVDLYSSITASATVSGKNLTINAPTLTTVGRLLYVANVGSYDFNIILAGTSVSISLKPNTTATLIWNGAGWTAAGASSSTDLQAAYNNTLTSAGGAELVLNAPGGAADGLTIRNNATTAITGALLEVQTSVGSNLLSVNNNAVEFAQNGGAESGTGTSFTNGWTASATGGSQATVSRDTTTGEYVTGVASVKIVTTGATTAGQGAADQIAVNGTNTSLTPNLPYLVSFTVKGTANFSTLDVVYSKDGTNTGTTPCAIGKTVTQSVWTRITCVFTAPSSGITSSNAIFIRQSDSNVTARTFFVDNLSINVSAGVNHAADGDADTAANIGAGTLNWAAVGTSTVSQTTSTIYNTSGAVSVATAGTVGNGVYNKLSNNIAPSTTPTQYRVAFYARGDGTNTANLSVAYTPDNGTTNISCLDYNQQTIAAGSYTLVSCYFTSTAAAVSNAQVRITQTGGTATTFYVDALSVTLNTNTASNVQVGGGSNGGPTTLFTLDRASTAPIAANNDAYLGSMYYDTTTGRIQCYEADGWGACGSAPDVFVTLTPEYTGAVLNGNGIGTLTADFCANSTALTVGTLCASNTSRQFYKWTSPQATTQLYSIYVSYKLPSTFKSFASDTTVNLTALSDNVSNGTVTYEMFRSTGGAISRCYNGATNETTVTTSSNTWQTVDINGNETNCGFQGGDNIIFKINVRSASSANVYVENLSFTYTNN